MHQPASQDTFSQFIGTWKLLECVQADAHGNLAYPWGNDATGYILYTPEGIMAVQIMRNTRSSMESSPSDIEYQNPPYNPHYLSYSGTFSLDETKKLVIHTAHVNFMPEMVGRKYIRSYRFYEDKLELTTHGETPVRTLTWQKVK